MMRRLIGSLTAGLLVIGLFAVPVRAEEKATPRPEPKLTSEQAQARLEEFFKLPEQSPTVQTQWSLSSRGAGPVWDLNVSIREGNGASGFSIGSVDAVTGRILQYSGGGAVPGPIRIGPLESVRTEADARARAWELVQKVVPDRAAGLHEALPGTPGYFASGYYPWGNTIQGDLYNFTWIEHHDGVPVPFSFVRVAVHKQTLEYVTLEVNLTEGMKYKPGPAKVTPEKALERWLSDVSPTMTYQAVTSPTFWGHTATGEFRLVYTYGGIGRMVDAMTGDWVQDPMPIPAPPQPQPKPAEPEVVPAGDVKPVLPDVLPLTEAAAHKLALTLLDLPADAELRRDPFFSGPEPNPAIRLSYYGQEQSASVQINPKTGLILGAFRGENRGPQMEAGDQAVTPAKEAEARQVAIKVVQTYFSQYRADLRLDSSAQFWGGPDEGMRRFQFIRYSGGIPVPGDGVWVNVDTKSMQWRDLGSTWTAGASFPSPMRALGPDAAKEILLSGRKPVLVYRAIYPPFDPRMDRWSMRLPTEAELVYTLVPGDGPMQLNALTGKPIEWDGLPYGSQEAAQAKVAGHRAEGALRFMIASRVIRADRVDPEGTLTRAEAVTLLLARSRSMMRGGSMMGPVALPFKDVTESHPARGAVQTAWTEGWLQPLENESLFRPDEPVTRAEFTVWTARALGLGELARSGLSVAPGYTDLIDLTTEQRNAATFLRSLGLLPESETFRGAAPMTQADAAVLTAQIYNSLLKP